MSPHRAFVVVSIALLYACNSDDTRPPNRTLIPGEGGEAGGGVSGTSGGGPTGGANQGGVSGGGDEGGASGSDSPSGSGGEGIGGASGSSGTGGVPPCPSDADVGSPPAITAQCDPAAEWGPPMDVPLIDGAAQLLAVTPDERTIAWYGSTVMGTTFYVADRASESVPFDPGQQLELRDFITLSPDGLRLVVLSGDGQGLTELTRTARGGIFGVPDEGAFGTLNAHASANGMTFSGCVISPDDRTLYYLATDAQEDYPLHVSTRAGSGPWPVGEPIAACEFQAHGGSLRQPTGVSADGLTLFFFDYVRGQARAAWRETVNGPFVWFANLGARERAQPNATCSRLYFTSPSGPAFSATN